MSTEEVAEGSGARTAGLVGLAALDERGQGEVDVDVVHRLGGTDMSSEGSGNNPIWAV